MTEKQNEYIAKDYPAIEYFFKHLNNFMRFKDKILKNGKLYGQHIGGMGIASIYNGYYEVCIGDLLKLYDGAWRIEKDGDTRYLIFIEGSPLSGGNHGLFWSVGEQKIVRDSVCQSGYQRFGLVFFPYLDLMKNRSGYDFALKYDDVPRELKELFAPLVKAYEEYAAKEAAEGSERQKKIFEARIKELNGKAGCRSEKQKRF